MGNSSFNFLDCSNWHLTRSMCCLNSDKSFSRICLHFALDSSTCTICIMLTCRPFFSTVTLLHSGNVTVSSAIVLGMFSSISWFERCLTSISGFSVATTLLSSSTLPFSAMFLCRWQRHIFLHLNFTKDMCLGLSRLNTARLILVVPFSARNLKCRLYR